jgi:hypothetical protein
MAIRRLSNEVTNEGEGMPSLARWFRHTAAGGLLMLLAGCGESHAPIEVPEHPAPRPKVAPQSMTAPPAQVKPRPRDPSRTSASLPVSVPLA